MSGGEGFLRHGDLRCDHAVLQVIFTKATGVRAHFHGVIHKEAAEKIHIHHRQFLRGWILRLLFEICTYYALSNGGGDPIAI